MKRIFAIATVVAASLFSAAAQAETVWGNWEGYDFSVNVSGSYATLSWDDGSTGFTAMYNPNPVPEPRCPCRVFEKGPRKITLEFNPTTGRYIKAYYSKSNATQPAVKSVRGEYHGYDFTVTLSGDEQTARLAWDDGAVGFTAFYTPYGAVQPRCVCKLYKNGLRTIEVEFDPMSGRPMRADYFKAAAN